MRTKYVMRQAKLIPLTDYNDDQTSTRNYKTKCTCMPAIVKTPEQKILLLIKQNSTLHVSITDVNSNQVLMKQKKNEDITQQTTK